MPDPDVLPPAMTPTPARMAWLLKRLEVTLNDLAASEARAAELERELQDLQQRSRLRTGW